MGMPTVADTKSFCIKKVLQLAFEDDAEFIVDNGEFLLVMVE